MASSSIAVSGAGSHPSLRVVLYLILIFFALFYLAPLYVMVSTSLKSVDENPARQPPGLAAGPELRRLGQGLVGRLRRN